MKNQKGNVNAVVIIILVILLAALGVTAYKFYLKNEETKKEKDALVKEVNELNAKVQSLQSTIDKVQNVIGSTGISENDNKKEYDDVILHARYAFSNSDVGYTFTKDGRAYVSNNISDWKGTYKTVAKNTIEAHYTQKKTIDELGGGEPKTENIDETITFIVDGNKLYEVLDNGSRKEVEIRSDVVEDNLF